MIAGTDISNADSDGNGQPDCAEVASNSDSNSDGDVNTDLDEPTLSSTDVSIKDNTVIATYPKASSSYNSNNTDIIKKLKDLFDSNPSTTITLTGYCSSEGDYDYNVKLSKSRAYNMKKYLVKNGISEDNIDIVGNGTNNPIAENETESGRAKNRRVEISINN